MLIITSNFVGHCGTIIFMRVSFRSPFRGNSIARKLYKRKLHRDVLVSHAEQKEKERRSRRSKEYKEILLTPQRMMIFVSLFFTQIILAGIIMWIIHSLIGVIRDHMLDHLVETFDALRRTHEGLNSAVGSLVYGRQ